MDQQPSTSTDRQEEWEDAGSSSTLRDDSMLAEAVALQEYSENSKLLLEYERQMFLDLCHSNGALVVCARGISYDVVLLSLLQVYGDPANLVLVINCSAAEESAYRRALNPKLVHEVANTAAAREKVYLEGGIQFVSTRILVVDLLKNRIPCELITGIIVLRAHDVIESCQEAFALRLFRKRNKTGFIKAFSQNAEQFTYGFGHIEKVMRNMFLSELLIWPRFHALIQTTLKEFEPTVVELHVPMSTRMGLLQTHILELMNYLVRELKRCNPRLDTGEITVENCLTKNFHRILQAQLDYIWHQLSSQTKLIISDLKVLRSVLMSVIYNDSVSVYSLLSRYRKTEYALNNSGWVLLDTAERLFVEAKARVFNDSGEFDPEWCPKWRPLTELLRDEIPRDIQKHSASGAANKSGVLILCRDAWTCSQLQQYLTLGAEKYLFYTALNRAVPVHKLGKDFERMTASNQMGRFRLDEQPDTKANNLKSSCKPTRKRRTVDKDPFKEDGDDEDDDMGVSSSGEPSPFVEVPDVLEASERDSYLLTLTQSDGDSFSVTNTQWDLDSTQYSEFSALLESQSSIDAPPPPIVCIQSFKTQASGSAALDRILNDMKPKYVIMYHCDMATIRQLEVFEARTRRPANARMTVFFLLHAETVEEQAYLTSLRREKEAFELIVQTKKDMVIETNRDGCFDLDDSKALPSELDTNQETRRAGGSVSSPAITPSRIVTDMREFRSELPCLIHRRGVEVIPVTITIGDYILTPDICVERKSISDLIGSLNSGRLYNQCVQMVRHYAKPVLLIEFDQNKPFHLQGRYMITAEGSTSGNNADIIKKLQLLTLHFPKLRLVWSPSPYATAQLFIELKQNKPEPDPDVAAAVGSDAMADLAEDQYNVHIYDFLLRLPGITPKNIGQVMRKGQNLRTLLGLSVPELEALLGSRTNAQLFHDIVHGQHKAPTEGVGSAFAKPKFVSKYRRK